MATQTVAKATKPIRFIRGERPLLGSLPEYQKDRLSLFKRIVASLPDTFNTRGKQASSFTRILALKPQAKAPLSMVPT